MFLKASAEAGTGSNNDSDPLGKAGNKQRF